MGLLCAAKGLSHANSQSLTTPAVHSIHCPHAHVSVRGPVPPQILMLNVHSASCEQAADRSCKGILLFPHQSRGLSLMVEQVEPWLTCMMSNHGRDRIFRLVTTMLCYMVLVSSSPNAAVEHIRYPTTRLNHRRVLFPRNRAKVRKGGAACWSHHLSDGRQCRRTGLKGKRPACSRYM